MSTIIQEQFLQDYVSEQPNAIILEAPIGADLQIRFLGNDEDPVDFVALEFDPNLIDDQHLLGQAANLGRNGIPLALCGRVDEAMAIRLSAAGWCHYDMFGNVDLSPRPLSMSVRQRDPKPDTLPNDMFDALLEREIDGVDIRVRGFWSDKQTRRGVVDDSCFSQWFEAPFMIDGIRYPTCEHWLMAEKARLMGDDAIRAQILESDHPGEAKSHGRRVRWFSQPVWDAESFGIAVRGNTAKFSHHHELRSHLLSTGNTVLVETSPVDRVWGIGLASDDNRCSRPSEWRGRNLLGFGLMLVRNRFAEAT